MVQEFIKHKKMIDKNIDEKFKEIYTEEKIKKMNADEERKMLQTIFLAKDAEFQKYFEMIDKDERYFECGCCKEYIDDLKTIVVAKCCKFANFHRNCLAKAGVVKGLCHFCCPLCTGNLTNLDLRPY